MTNTESPSNILTHLIIVMGVSGCGKSTLAQNLALHLNFTYIDADDFHSASSRELMASGIALTDTQRTPWVESIKQHLQKNAKENTHTVLAFSGLKKKHRDALRNLEMNTFFMCLSGNKTNIQKRMHAREKHFMPPQLLDSQFSSFEVPENEADVYFLDANESIHSVFIQAKTLADKIVFSPSNPPLV